MESLLSVPLENKPISLGINFSHFSDRLHKIMKQPDKYHTIHDDADIEKKNELLKYYFEEISRHVKYFRVYFDFGITNHKIRVIIYKQEKYEKELRKDVDKLRERAIKRLHNTLNMEETTEWTDALCIQRNHNLAYPDSKPFCIERKFYNDVTDPNFIVYCVVCSGCKQLSRNQKDCLCRKDETTNPIKN